MQQLWNTTLGEISSHKKWVASPKKWEMSIAHFKVQSLLTSEHLPGAGYCSATGPLRMQCCLHMRTCSHLHLRALSFELSLAILYSTHGDSLLPPHMVIQNKENVGRLGCPSPESETLYNIRCASAETKPCHARQRLAASAGTVITMPRYAEIGRYAPVSGHLILHINKASSHRLYNCLSYPPQVWLVPF